MLHAVSNLNQIRALSIVAVLLVLGACANRSTELASAPEPSSVAGDVAAAPAARSVDTVKIATFNIQVFGVTKRENPDIMAVLTKVARKFDILAIQEVRDSSETTVKYFLDQINEGGGATYKAISGPRLGRSNSKEQYAIFYNTEKVQYVANSAYTYSDPRDVFEREPFIARFKAGNFSFVLIDIHTKPDDAAAEIGGLDSVVSDALRHFSGEKDVIALGDYNGDCAYFDAEEQASRLQASKYLWIVPDSADTTTRGSTDCAYDRMVTLKGIPPKTIPVTGEFSASTVTTISPKTKRLTYRTTIQSGPISRWTRIVMVARHPEVAPTRLEPEI